MSIDRLRGRQEWRFLAVLWRADRRLALVLHAAMALYYAFDQASVPADRPA